MPLAVSGGLKKTDFCLTTKFNKMQETNNTPQNPPLQQTAVRRSFLQEFEYPLDKVQRKWIRRPITLLFSPILIIAGALFGAFEMGKQWFDECW